MKIQQIYSNLFRTKCKIDAYFALLVFWFVLGLPATAQKTPQPTDCVGEIAGECITYEYFMGLAMKYTEPNQTPDYYAIEVAWRSLLFDRIYLPEAQKAGLVLPADIAENRPMKDALFREFTDLLRYSNYLTKSEMEREYEKKAIKAHIRYLYIPYSLFPDEAFEATITEEELTQKLNNSPRKYINQIVTETNYIIFPTEDEKEVRQAFSSVTKASEMQKIFDKYKNNLYQGNYNLGVHEYQFQEIKRTREVLLWAYNARVEEVALFKIMPDDSTIKWIMVGVTNQLKYGETNVQNARGRLMYDVIKDKKAQDIMKSLDLKQPNLEAIAKKYKKGASLVENLSLTLQADCPNPDRDICNIIASHKVDTHKFVEGRNEPEVVGKAMGLPEGKRICVAGERGVYVIEKVKDTPVTEPYVHSEEWRIHLASTHVSGMHLASTQDVIRELKQVKDYRYKFW